MKSRTYCSLWYIVAIFIVCLVILWPLTRHGFYISDDGEWMVIRLSAFFQSFREGQFPVRFLGRLNHSFGYPVANFLYPGFLYIGSLIHAAGFSFLDSVKIILGASVAGSSVFLFFWLRQHFSRFSSFAGALSFTFFPYVLFDLYKRGSVGEVMAFLPASVALYAIDSRKRWLFPAALALLVISHNILALMFFVFFLGTVVIEKRWEYALPFVLGIAMTCFFWFPAFYERQYVIFDSIAISDPRGYVVDSGKMFLLAAPALVAFLLLFALHKKQAVNRWYLWIFAVSILMSTSLSLPLWKSSIISSMIQFPYRFLAVSAIVGCYAVAACFEHIKPRFRLLLFVICIMVWIAVFVRAVAGIEYVLRPEGYYTTNEDTTTVAGEYMPRWAKIIPLKRADHRMELYEGKAALQTLVQTTQKLKVLIDAREDSIIQINTIYYPGWGATIDDKRVPIRFDNPQGLMRVSVPSGKHRMTLDFHETVQRFIADIISAAGVVAYIAFIIGSRKKFVRKRR
ncbi:hypothetical protein KKG44_02725 [Patescibacteria group bacterium]|nr:hypothetical protein [Patescibacteria group bacterium]MBU2460009.1 hypothetical protein [Patescibacteria group bacterium]MBU2544333.1 hypothetical protein [Patescibacteria group bacterium]